MTILDRIYPERPVKLVFLMLLLGQLLLISGHIGAIVVDTAAPSETTAIFREFFGLSTEGNAPTWFSSLLFTLIGLVCGALYWVEGHQASEATTIRKTRPAWLVFAALFMFLSFDETSQFHERLDWLMSGLEEGGQASAAAIADGAEERSFYQYLLIYIPVLGAFGLAMAWFVMRRFQRPVTAFLFLAGMAGFALKLVIESFEQWSLSTRWFGHSLYLEAVIVEMSCLFTGATLILTALLSYLFGLADGFFPTGRMLAMERNVTTHGQSKRPI